MSNVVVIGGHGKIALKLAAELRQRGHQVSSVVRNPEHENAVTQAGGRPLVLDVEKASTSELAATLRGHDVVVFSAGAGGGNPERTRAVDRDAAVRAVDAAAQAGVQRFLMVSFLGAQLDHGLAPDNSFYAYAQAKAEADDYLRRSALDYVIAGPSGLTADEPTGEIHVVPRADATSGATGGAETSRANVALVLAAVIENPKVSRTTIDFTDGTTPIDRALAAVTS